MASKREFGFVWHNKAYWCRYCTKEVPSQLLEQHERVCEYWPMTPQEMASQIAHQLMRIGR
jgi:hypothetical protein